ncbi:MAG: hypothetical protein AAB899_00105 [Patescibacteria group bacterium]
MVLRKTIDNLKARPHHERRAVAKGTALLVAGILFIAWLIWFFNDIRVNGIQVEPINLPKPGAFDTQPLTEAKQQIQNSFGGLKDSIQAAQNATVPAE